MGSDFSVATWQASQKIQSLKFNGKTISNGESGHTMIWIQEGRETFSDKLSKNQVPKCMFSGRYWKRFSIKQRGVNQGREWYGVQEREKEFQGDSERRFLGCQLCDRPGERPIHAGAEDSEGFLQGDYETDGISDTFAPTVLHF